jgi:hypothetical protein
LISCVRIMLLTGALLTITLPLKFLVPQPSAVAHMDLQLRSRTLRDFLTRNGMRPAGPVQLKPPNVDWPGWVAEAPHCHFLVAPALFLEDGNSLLQLVAGRGRNLRFIYRGDISDSVPIARINRDSAMDRILWPIHPPRWRPPMLIAVITPSGCDAYQKLPWRSLWGR